jgi:AI-2 transport system permease protein
MIIRFLQRNREASVALIIILLFAVLGLVDHSYLSIDTVALVYGNSLILFVLAIGATMVMATHGLDVSVGSIMGLAAVVAGLLMNAGWAVPSAIFVALLVGLVCGLFNGILVSLLKVSAIVATLGTLGLYRGFVHLLSGGAWIEGLPEGFKALTKAGSFGLSFFAWLVLALLVVAHLSLRYTAVGRSLFAVGDNRDGARLIGIRVDEVQIVAYGINGVLAALAGVIFASQIGFIPNTAGTGMEMRAIASSVLGGVSLLGGTGTVLGAALGAYFMTSIDSILVLLRLEAYWNDIIAGAILLVVLITDGKIREAVDRHLRYQKYRKFIEPQAASHHAEAGKSAALSLKTSEARK